MDPLEIINKYYEQNPKCKEILLNHSYDVTDMALRIAQRKPELNADMQFIQEAAMLHDIGIIKTYAPDLYCDGDCAYICHGYLGSDMLKAEGFEKHALVCERHTGAGLSLAHIIEANLPIPRREMLPLSLEEQIICFADKFFSKTHLGEERNVKKARAKLEKYGEETLKRFDNWCQMFL
ncbi:MAG: HDIG domain-containing protein [Paludibacteraceae bacterium]|nr:HDIG domain-containing protein [Paludibacteraceae bacterium]